MPKPELIIFDVNETLLDLSPLKACVANALNGNDHLLPLWFSKMVHYSTVETLTGTYHSFGEIGTAVLTMIAKTQGIELSEQDAKNAVEGPIESLPPHPDVITGLQMLKTAGHRIVSLTNSPSSGLKTRFDNANISHFFEKLYSIDAIKKYKPHPDAYHMVLGDLGIDPHNALMVAAHAWDLAGAKNAGLRTAFIARPGKTLYPKMTKPDHHAETLSELAKALSIQN